MEAVQYLERYKAPTASRSLEISEDYYKRFIDYLDCKPKTVTTYTGALKQFAEYLKAHRITRPEREDIKAYREELESSGKKANTIYAYIFIVRRFFEWTADEGIYPNVAGKIKGAKISKQHKKEALADRQVEDLLANIDRSTVIGKRDYAIIYTMLTCGLREIEITRANIKDMQSTGGGTILHVQGKGHDDADDTVNLPEDTETVIKEYLEARGATDPEEPLFTSNSNHNAGGRLNPCSVSRLCKQHLKGIGIDNERYTAHSFRHTAVTFALLENNGNIQATAQFARHANIETTLIYAHNLEARKNTCSRQIANRIAQYTRTTQL